MNTESFSDFVSERACHRTRRRTKSNSDVQTLKRLARFVIVVKPDLTTTLIDNGHRALTVPLIVVVGTIHDHSDVQYSGSLLEIGYNRARPYRRIHINKNKVLVWARNPKPQLSKQQIAVVYPKILECLEMVLIETRQRWKTKDAWWANGRLVERGVQITVDTTDSWLHREFLRENVRYFQSCWFPRYRRWINRRLLYTKTNRFPCGPSAQKAIDSIAASGYAKSPILLEALLRIVEKRSVIEGALIRMNMFHHLTSDEVSFVFNEDNWVKLASPQNFFIWHTLDQPTDGKGIHAKNCARFEVLFDREREPRTYLTAIPEWKEVHLTEGQKHDADFCPF